MKLNFYYEDNWDWIHAEQSSEAGQHQVKMFYLKTIKFPTYKSKGKLKISDVAPTI